MDAQQGSRSSITLDTRLHTYENQWVALDADLQVVASDERLPDLVERVASEKRRGELTYLQVLPHNLSFISGASV